MELVIAWGMGTTEILEAYLVETCIPRAWVQFPQSSGQ